MKKIRFSSKFSGIEAASVAWEALGWRCVSVAEIDKAASRVLAHHYPDVPNLGSVTDEEIISKTRELNPNVLVGGPPCQDFSVAGLRAGLQGARGNLSLRWAEIIKGVKDDDGFICALTENVPGWLTANGGAAFGAFLASLVGCDSLIVPPSRKRGKPGRWTRAGMVDGPEGRAAWRVLDAQYFGLAQRRQRVFVVFCPRNGADPAEILFEREGVRRDTPPSREEGAAVAALTANGVGTCGADDNQGQAGHLVPCGIDRKGYRGGNCSGPIEVAATLTAKGVRQDFEVETFVTDVVAHTLRGEGFDASEDGTGRGIPLVAVHVAPTIEASAVRRLTPRECERLQGFPDDYTLVPVGKKMAADGPRYKQLGNSKAVTVVRWLGRRIEKYSGMVRS